MSKSPTYHTTTILFTDLVGSSKLYTRLGNEQAQATIDALMTQLKSVVTAYLGKTIKTIGDEIMCRFDRASDASDAAIEMHIYAHQINLQLKTGISTGEVIEHNDDIYGDTVNNAAFLANIAQARQILLVDETKNKLPSRLIESIERFDSIVFKGNTSSTWVNRLNWEAELTTNIGATMVSQRSSFFEANVDTEIQLRYEDEDIKLTKEDMPFTFGRDGKDTDLFINSPRSSRKHGSIHYRQNNFILEDHSTNGTYIKQKNSPEVFLRREAFPLHEQGCFSVGVSSDPKASKANKNEIKTITFTVR